MELSFGRSQSLSQEQQLQQQMERQQQREQEIEQSIPKLKQEAAGLFKSNEEVRSAVSRYTPEQQEALSSAVGEAAARAGARNPHITGIRVDEDNNIVGRVNKHFPFKTNIDSVIESSRSKTMPEYTDLRVLRPGIDTPAEYTIRKGDSLSRIGHHFSPNDKELASAVSMFAYHELHGQKNARYHRGENRVVLTPGDKFTVDLSDLSQDQIKQLARAFNRYQTQEHKTDIAREQQEQARQAAAAARREQAGREQAALHGESGQAARQHPQFAPFLNGTLGRYDFGQNRHSGQIQVPYRPGAEPQQKRTESGEAAEQALKVLRNADLSPLSEARRNNREYWDEVADNGVKEQNPAKYFAGRIMGGIGQGVYGALETGRGMADHPEAALRGAAKGVGNLVSDIPNTAVNLAKTSADGYTHLAESLPGVKRGAFEDFRRSTPFNFERPFPYRDNAEEGGAALSQTLATMGAAAGGRKIADAAVDLQRGLESAQALHRSRAQINRLAEEAAETNRELYRSRALSRDEPYIAPVHREMDGDFQTHGIKPKEVPVNIQQNMRESFNAEKYFEQAIESGDDIPIPRMIAPGEKLYKVVSGTPETAMVGPYSSYWMNAEQLKIIQANPNLTNSTLGLPASSQGSRFQLFEIQPMPGEHPVVYQSTIATVSNKLTDGIVTADVGKGQQVLVPQRELWSEPKHIGEIIVPERK